MLELTAAAKKRFEEMLNLQARDPEHAFRITVSKSDPNALDFEIGPQKELDEIIETEQGEKLIFIGNDVAPVLENTVIDYKEDEGFILNKKEKPKGGFVSDISFG